MAFLPPFSGVFRLSLSGSWPGIPCRRSFDFQGSMKACRKHITIKQVFLGRIRSGFEGENRTWEVRFMWTALERAYHKVTQIFRKHYFHFLPSKPEVIVPVWCNIKWINADFFKTNFSPRKFAYSVSAETRSQRNFVRNIGFRRSPTIVFEVGFVKSDSKNCELVPTCPACYDCKCKNFLNRKITVRFKLNLKTDGLNCKMIFKSGERIERLHSCSKQCVVLSAHLNCSLGLGICIAHWLWTSQNQHNCSKQCRRIYICELVGARPLHLLSQTVLSLKSPTGAFIAPLRSANANFALQNTCWEFPNPWTASCRCRLCACIAKNISKMPHSTDEN